MANNIPTYYYHVWQRHCENEAFKLDTLSSATAMPQSQCIIT